MTDEEKLEKIKRTREQIENFCNYNCSVSKGDVVCLNCVRILDFQTGLAEGRKEVFVYNDGIPEDKDKLCIFYDYDGYFIDTFNNLSSSDQKNLKKWIYLPLADK